MFDPHDRDAPCASEAIEALIDEVEAGQHVWRDILSCVVHRLKSEGIEPTARDIGGIMDCVAEVMYDHYSDMLTTLSDSGGWSASYTPENANALIEQELKQ